MKNIENMKEKPLIHSVFSESAKESKQKWK